MIAQEIKQERKQRKLIIRQQQNNTMMAGMAAPNPSQMSNQQVNFLNHLNIQRENEERKARSLSKHYRAERALLVH